MCIRDSAKKGAARVTADKEGYKTFIIPDNVGGRFSVLTPVGLLPIAAVSYTHLLCPVPLSPVPETAKLFVCRQKVRYQSSLPAYCLCFVHVAHTLSLIHI